MEAAQSPDPNAWPPQASAQERTAREAQRAPARDEAHEQQAAKDWVREHQDIALIAAFALGVFMGMWMKG